LRIFYDLHPKNIDFSGITLPSDYEKSDAELKRLLRANISTKRYIRFYTVGEELQNRYTKIYKSLIHNYLKIKI
jgi:hypothetical protein